MIRQSLAVAMLPLLLAASHASAQAAAQPVTPMTPNVVASYQAISPDAADYIKREVMIPMRDGVKLYTVIVFRKGTKNGPILLSRTPYDAKDSAARSKSDKITEILPAMDAEFVNDGYIRVYQDIRGMYNSEGQFVMTRPIIGTGGNDTKVDESTDAYDTIDWLVKNTPESNGKVGVVGSSYLGFTTLMTEINPHPALKAVAPQSPMVDTWIGDDAFHNGAFRVSQMDYVVEQSTAKGEGGGPVYGDVDYYSMYLNDGSMGDHARKYGMDKYPFNQLILEHPAYDKTWSDVAVDKWMAKQPVTVPTMLIVGQWDQEDSYGSPAVYKAMKPNDTNGLVHLVIGPWRHSGVNHYGYGLGALTFTGDTADQFRVEYLKPFFDHYLKDAPDPHTPTALTYATGIDKWDSSPKWPVGKPVKLFLHDDGKASFDAPAKEASDHDDYVSDPTGTAWNRGSDPYRSRSRNARFFASTSRCTRSASDSPAQSYRSTIRSICSIENPVEFGAVCQTVNPRYPTPIGACTSGAYPRQIGLRDQRPMPRQPPRQAAPVEHLRPTRGDLLQRPRQSLLPDQRRNPRCAANVAAARSSNFAKLSAENRPKCGVDPNPNRACSIAAANNPAQANRPCCACIPCTAPKDPGTETDRGPATSIPPA